MGPCKPCSTRRRIRSWSPCRFSLLPVQREAGEAVGINHDKRERLMRQQRAPHFLETGAVYVMRTPGFQQAHHRFFGTTVMYVMPPERCLEIDTPLDLQRAELVLQQRAQQQK